MILNDSRLLKHAVLPSILTLPHHFAIIEIKKNFFIFFYNLLVCASRTTTTKDGLGKQGSCQ